MTADQIVDQINACPQIVGVTLSARKPPAGHWSPNGVIVTGRLNGWEKSQMIDLDQLTSMYITPMDGLAMIIQDLIDTLNEEVRGPSPEKSIHLVRIPN